MTTHAHTKASEMIDSASEETERLGKAVADLVGNVVDNALGLAEEVVRDAGRVAAAGRNFLRSLRDA